MNYVNDSNLMSKEVEEDDLHVEVYESSCNTIFLI